MPPDPDVPLSERSESVPFTLDELRFLLAAVTNTDVGVTRALTRRDVLDRLKSAEKALTQRIALDGAREIYQDALVEIASTPKLTITEARQIAAATVRGARSGGSGQKGRPA
jgi:hypothetical protein